MIAQWTAVVLAGQRPAPDPLAQHFGQSWKALVPITGQPMIVHVVRTLRQSPSIGRIIILAQKADVIVDAVLRLENIEFSKSQSGISDSLQAIVGSNAAPWPVLVTTADHPLLTTDMIEEFLANAQADIAVGMVERKAMLAQFPDAKRTWLKFADGAWSGANLFALTSEAAKNALAVWAGVEQDRKKAFKLFLHFGPVLALRAMTRTIGLSEALLLAGRRIGITAQLITLSDPVAAIDVDKLVDHELAEKIMRERADVASKVATQ